MIRILLSARLGEKRWAQADLARATGIRRNNISEMWNEISRKISLEELDLICEALNCDVSDILVYEPNDVPKVTRNRAGQPLHTGKE
jgi:putative transcriptional regulator